MSPFIIGDRFVKALLDAGIVDNDTTRVVIDAKVGDAVMLYTERIGDHRLAVLVESGGIVVTDDPDKAVAR